MSNLGNLYYTLGIKDMTDADLQKIHQKLAKFNFNIDIKSAKVKKDAIELPKGITITIEKAKIEKNILQDAVNNQNIKLNITKESLENAIKGKVIQVEVLPLIGKLRDAIINTIRTTTGGKAPVEVNANTLQQSIRNVLRQNSFSVNVDTPNLSKKVRTAISGVNYPVSLTVNPRTLAANVKAAVDSLQTNNYNLQINRNILIQSINNALGGHTFYVNIAVTQNQARMAIQNALNAANLINKSDAKTYEALKKGEYYAAKAEQAHNRAAKAANTHAHASLNLGGVMGSNIRIAGELGMAMGSLYSVHALKEFLANVVEIGGELEHQKIAMDTIFGDKGKTTELFGQIKGLARTSPFGVMELTKSVKALSAFGVKYNEIYDTAKRLADISAATSVDINRLILALGKTKSRTFLDGVEAKQFAYANIPIYELLSKKLTEIEGKFVSIGEVMERQKKREISYDLVKSVLWDITDPGGQFYNMQEALAGSVKTSWKLVRDNIELMFGEIAESKVGDWLKGIAQILQKATQNWKALAVVGAEAIGIFGIYKLALNAVNITLGKNLAASVSKIALTEAECKANLDAIILYRNLNRVERENMLAAQGANKIRGLNILSRKQLTYHELQALHAKQLLNREEILRLVALKKVSIADAERILITKNMTQAEIQATKAAIVGAEAAKKSAVIKAQVKAQLIGIGETLKSLVFNPFTAIMAGVGLITSVYYKYSASLEKTKEISDNLFTKASEGSKNLKDVISSLKDYSSMSKLEVGQSIENMINALKDYSPHAMEDINNSIVDQNGNLLTTAERYELLKKKVLELGDAYKHIESLPLTGLKTGVKTALDNTGGLFDDNLIANAEDYSKALNNINNRITELLANHRSEVVSSINTLESVSSIAKQELAHFKTYEEKLEALIKHQGVSEKTIETFNSHARSASGHIDTDNGGITRAYNELISDTDRFVLNMNAKLKQLKWNPAKLTDDQKNQLSIALKHMIDSMDKAGDDAKAVIAKKFEDVWNITVIEDKIGPAMQEKFRNMISTSADESVSILKDKLFIQGYGELSDAEKATVLRLMGDARNQVQKELGIMNGEMQHYLNTHPLEQQIKLSFTNDSSQPSSILQEVVKEKGIMGYSANATYVKNWLNTESVYEARNKAQEDRQKAQNEYDAAVTAGLGVAEAKAKKDAVERAIKYLGWADLEVKDRKSNKHTSPKQQKDSFAEALKQEFKDYKDAWNEFKKWSQIIGKDEALEKVKNSGLFDSVDEIPVSESDFRNKLNDIRRRLQEKEVKGKSQRESLLNELIKEDFEIDRQLLTDNLKKSLDEVERIYEEQIEQWNMYEKLKTSLGNETLAINLAFGLNTDSIGSYEDLIKSQFRGRARALGKDNLKFDDYSNKEDVRTQFGDEISNAWEKAYNALEKYKKSLKEDVNSIIEQYQTSSDKITKINSDAETKKDKVRKSNMPEDLKNKIIDRIENQREHDVLSQDAQYLAFFDSIYALSLSKAEEIGKSIRENLDKRFKDGTISAKEYAEEVNKIESQTKKLKNVRSESFIMLKDGLKGVYSQRIEQLQDKLEVAIASGDKEKEIAIRAEIEGYENSIKTMETINVIASTITNTVGEFSNIWNSIKSMADSFGVDTSDGSWSDIQLGIDILGNAADGFSKIASNLLSGNIVGAISGVVATITGFFTIFNKWHDSKLDAQIKKSEKIRQNLQYAYDRIEQKLNRTFNPLDKRELNSAIGDLLNVNVNSNNLFSAELELMKGQLKQLEQEKTDIENMKKTDTNKLQEKNKEIDEMRDKISYYAEDIANTLYGINLNDWASQISDSLVSAFENGTDAAEAFDDAVSNIMKSVVSNMLKVGMIKPLMEELREYCFGKNGILLDYKLTESETTGLMDKIYSLKDKALIMQEIWDRLNKELGGMLDSKDSSKNGLSGGIQNITEDTADLLASYINSIRAYCAQSNVDIKTLVDSRMPELSEIAKSQLTQLNAIAINTQNSAMYTEQLYQVTQQIQRILTNANRIKDGGFYLK